jgi:hypothetical protein
MRQSQWIALALPVIVGVGQAASAATVRGKLVRGQAAAAGIAVTVQSPQKVRSTPAISGSNGMYYIPNVKAGSYTLEVWVKPNQPLTFPIQVKEPESDINPVQVP